MYINIALLRIEANEVLCELYVNGERKLIFSEKTEKKAKEEALRMTDGPVNFVFTRDYLEELLRRHSGAIERLSA